MALVVAGSWGLFVLALAGAVCPAPSRSHELTASARPPRGPAWDSALEAIGRAAATLWTRSARRRDSAITPVVARRLGQTIVAAGVAALISTPLALPAALGGWFAPTALARRARAKRLAEIEADLPEVVDLICLAIGSGLNVALAVEAVGRRGTGPLAGELRLAHERSSRGRRLADALEELPGRSGEAVRPLVAALVAGDRYGAPLADGLERLAAESRAAQRRRCETAARRVPVTLLFPLVVCILPAFALLTVAPLLASGLGSLRL